ncbi:MAG: IS1595 family transposase [Actinomycetota bacterium]|nr:IS1595 family transposase [Actinomycetota bacterium]
MRDGGYEKVGDLAQFMQPFPNEGACREYLFRRRWPQGFVCPRCGCARCYPIARRGIYRCAACRYQASVIAGTVMEKTRTSLWAWFLLIFLMARNETGLSVTGFSRLTGITYKRAWLMARKIRAAMEERDSAYLLAGFLEMDKSYFAATREGKRGRGAE